MTDPKQLIVDVLESIGYEENKDKFASDFLSISLQEAMMNLMQGLPQDKQDQLTHRVSLVGPDKLEGLLLEYFSKEDFSNALSKASSSAIESYLETISGSLNDEQKTKLEQHLSTLGSPL